MTANGGQGSGRPTNKIEDAVCGNALPAFWDVRGAVPYKALCFHSNDTPAVARGLAAPRIRRVVRCDFLRSIHIKSEFTNNSFTSY